MRRPEQAVQGNIVRHLPFILPRDAFMFAVPNGGARVGKEGAIFQRQGVVAGVPDLIVLWAGRAFGLEVKAEKGTLSAKQVAAHAAMRRAGAPVAVVRSLPDAIAFFREQQVPLRIKEGSA
jgi:hypothetical protein